MIAFAPRALRRLAVVIAACAACAALLAPAAAEARSKAADSRPGKGSAKKGKLAELDPARWFATRTGLIRVYQERPKAPAKGKSKKSVPAPEDGAAPPAGASCEVVESLPREGDTPPRTRESCTMISARKAKAPAALTYELRPTGIYMIKAETEGHKPVLLDRLLLPLVKKGKSWSEKRGKLVLVRTVKSAGAGCKAAGRSFGDCLVLKAVEKEGKKVKRTYAEIYAAGVGLVEDAQWELIDVKGL